MSLGVPWLSCLVLPCLVYSFAFCLVSCLVLPCLVLSYLVLSCLFFCFLSRSLLYWFLSFSSSCVLTICGREGNENNHSTYGLCLVDAFVSVFVSLFVFVCVFVSAFVFFVCFTFANEREDKNQSYRTLLFSGLVLFCVDLFFFFLSCLDISCLVLSWLV